MKWHGLSEILKGTLRFDSDVFEGSERETLQECDRKTGNDVYGLGDGAYRLVPHKPYGS